MSNDYDIRLHDAAWDRRLLDATRRGEANWSASGLIRWRNLHDVARQMSRQFPDNMQWRHNLNHARNMVEIIEYRQHPGSA